MYLRARYYDPGLGVFPSLDPLENLNRYQYVGANPTNYTDPTGLQGPVADLCEQLGVIEPVCDACLELGDPIDQAICVALASAGTGAVVGTGAQQAVEVAGAVSLAFGGPLYWLTGALAATAALTVHMCIEGGATGDPLIDLVTCGTTWPYGDGAHLPVPTPPVEPQMPPGATATPGTRAATAVANDPAGCQQPVPQAAPEPPDNNDDCGPDSPYDPAVHIPLSLVRSDFPRYAQDCDILRGLRVLNGFALEEYQIMRDANVTIEVLWRVPTGPAGGYPLYVANPTMKINLITQYPAESAIAMFHELVHLRQPEMTKFEAEVDAYTREINWVDSHFSRVHLSGTHIIHGDIKNHGFDAWLTESRIDTFPAGTLSQTYPLNPL